VCAAGVTEPVLIYVNVRGMYSFGRETCVNSRLGGGGKERKEKAKKESHGKVDEQA